MWEQKREELYKVYYELEAAMETDEDLANTIAAEKHYHEFLSSYGELFRDDERPMAQS